MKQFSKVAVSPVVATALLLVVAVVSVVGFQGWFTSFSSGLMIDVESDTASSVSSVKVDGIINNDLYLNSKLEDAKLKSLSVLDSNGVEICNFSASDDLNLSGLIGHWNFEDNDKIIKDISGNGYDGLLFGNSKLILDFNSSGAIDKTAWNNSGVVNSAIFNSNCGLNGGCYDFDGVDDYIGFSGKNLHFRNFTINMWINAKSYGSDVNVGGVLFSNYLNLKGSILYLSDTGNISFRPHGNGSTFKLFTDVINLNEWIFVSAVVDDNKFSIYLNGDLSAFGEFGLYDNNSVVTPTIGKASWSDYAYFNGSIDEVGIYSKALGASDIKNLYKSQKAGFIEFSKGGVEIDGVGNLVDLKFNSGYSSTLSGIIEFDLYDNYNFLVERGMYHCLISSFQGNPRGWQLCIGNEVYPLYLYSDTKVVVYELDYKDLMSSNSKNQLYFAINNGTYSKMFLNGFEIGSNFSNVSILNSNELNISLGVRADSLGGAGFNGRFYDLKLFDRNLSVSEIKNNYLAMNSLNTGVSKVDLSGCKLDKKQKYEIVGTTEKGLFNYEVVSR